MSTLQYNCVNPYDIKELSYIIDNMTPIALQTFQNHVDNNDFSYLQAGLGYGPKFPISKDWHVKFYKCYLPKKKKTAYILVHSVIEYVFY